MTGTTVTVNLSLWGPVRPARRSPSFWTAKASRRAERSADLDHSQQALVGGGVSGDGEAAGRVSGDDAVHCAPGLGVRLVFVGHSQVGDDDVDSVLVNLTEELTGAKKTRPFNCCR